MSTRNIYFRYRTPKRYPTIISIVPPGVALIATFRGSNYRCLEQIFMVPKRFEPSKFDCMVRTAIHHTSKYGKTAIHHSRKYGKNSNSPYC